MQKIEFKNAVLVQDDGMDAYLTEAVSSVFNKAVLVQDDGTDA